MKTFIEYLAEAAVRKTGKKYQPFETVFGKHSKEEKKHQPFETVFGKHSQSEKKTVKEEFEVLEEVKKASEYPGDNAKEQIAKHTYKEENEIHKNSGTQESEAIKRYTTSSSLLNKHLHAAYRKKLGIDHRKGDINDYQEKNKEHLDKALDKASFPHDTHVYTGLPHSPHHAFKHTGTEGKSVKVHLPAYTSTSTDFEQAHDFSKHDDSKVDHKNHPPLNKDSAVGIKRHDTCGGASHVLKLHIPKGTKAASVTNQSAHNENEILLHRGHNIEIHHQPTVMKDGTHVWHARVISHTPHD